MQPIKKHWSSFVPNAFGLLKLMFQRIHLTQWCGSASITICTSIIYHCSMFFRSALMETIFFFYFLQIIAKVSEQHWAKTSLLWDPIRHRPKMWMIQLGLPFWALLAHHLLIDLVWGTFVLGSANYFNQSAAWDWVKCLTDVETHNEDTATFISSTCNFTKKPHWAHLTRLFHEAVLMTINYAAVFWAFFNSDPCELVGVGWSCNANEPWGRGHLLSHVICRPGAAQGSISPGKPATLLTLPINPLDSSVSGGLTNLSLPRLLALPSVNSDSSWAFAVFWKWSRMC